MQFPEFEFDGLEDDAVQPAARRFCSISLQEYMKAVESMSKLSVDFFLRSGRTAGNSPSGAAPRLALDEIRWQAP